MRKSMTQLRLNSLVNCRKTIGRLARDFYSDPEADIARCRCTGYLLKILVETFKIEKDERWETDMALVKKELGIET